MINIAKYIKYALSAQNAPDLNEVIEGNVYHIVVPNDEHIKEYICHWSEGATPETTKDGIYGYTFEVSIRIVAKTPEALYDIIEEVEKAMHTAPEAWNAQEDIDFTIDDQTYRIGEEVYDPELDEWPRTLTYTIETSLN